MVESKLANRPKKGGLMAVKKNRVLIRPGSGADVGSGHLMRMLALAGGCRRLGFGVSFAVGDIPGTIARKITDLGCELILVTAERGSEDDANETHNLATDRNADWLVLDGYCFDDHYQGLVKPDTSLLMVVDDFGHGTHFNADMVLNQNAYADASRYHELPDTKVLCGIRYTMLKPEFDRQQNDKTQKQKVRGTAKRILVTMGGSDTENFTLPVVQALGQIDGCRAADLIVDCVTGPNFAHEQTLRTFERSSEFRFRIHRNVDRMDVLMRNADLAITAGGSTCYELAKLGIPAIAIPTAENQVPVVKDLAKRNTLCRFKAAQVQRGTGKNEKNVLSKFIKTIIDDAPQRQAMSDAGKKLIDGRGVNRVARAMYSELLEFRNATMDDAEVLLGWRNDPEVRSVSFASSIIQPDEHQQWLSRSISMPDRILLMAEDRQGTPIGKIQIDFTSETLNSVKIGIVVGQGHRARGLGTILIEKSTSALFKAEKNVQQIVAQVKPGNLASERAFRKAGFISAPSTTVNQQLAHEFILHRFYQSYEDVNRDTTQPLSISRAA
jgi:UDP-2,4-diacetamido-2,4,6-trideoxy-beta-L-altropyranose hydrolase